MVADALSDGNAEWDKAELGWMMLYSGCLLSVWCPSNTIASLYKLEQP